jgi:HPt (histidine-containing phosphotransfer) domain-containing protein
MEEIDTEAKFDAVMLELRGEFITACQDMLNDIDGLIDRIRAKDEVDNAFMELRRIVHSLKGQGATFGFPLITHIAHMLEDYIETLLEVTPRTINDIQKFVDRISTVLESPTTPTKVETEAILAALPNVRSKEFTDQIVKDMRALVVMPKCIQRKIIGQELVSCGFRLSFASSALTGLESALAFPPHIVFASMEIQGFTGSELAGVFHSIHSLSDAHFIVLTSYDMDSERLNALPPDVRIIHKDADFAEQLVEYMMEWGVFGELGRKTT